MIKKIRLVMIIFFGAASLMFTGCSAVNDSADANLIPVHGDGTYSGKVTGIGRGGFGGNITVTLDVANGRIKDVEVTHFETPEYGADLIEEVIPLIIRANSFEIDAITSSSLTQTITALLEAGNDAISKIPNILPPGIK